MFEEVRRKLSPFFFGGLRLSPAFITAMLNQLVDSVVKTDRIVRRRFGIC